MERLEGGVCRLGCRDQSVEAGSVFTRHPAIRTARRANHIVHRGTLVFAILNAFPYATGHTLVVPYREVADLEDLDAAESSSCGQR